MYIDHRIGSSEIKSRSKRKQKQQANKHTRKPDVCFIEASKLGKRLKTQARTRRAPLCAVCHESCMPETPLAASSSQPYQLATMQQTSREWVIYLRWTPARLSSPLCGQVRLDKQNANTQHERDMQKESSWSKNATLGEDTLRCLRSH